MRPFYDLASVFADHIRGAADDAGRMYEPVIAIVTDNRDPSKLGRVRVKIPILSDADASAWAPIIMLGAGNQRGWFFIPEVDDEVLLMFEHGDVNRPLVVGALWNGKDRPPANNTDGGNHLRVIRSRAGSTITFDDDPAVLQVALADGLGNGKITLDARANKITFEALVGDVCLQAPVGELQIVARNIELEAGERIELGAGTSMSWGAGRKLELKGKSVTLGGSQANAACGNARAPQAPTVAPENVADPYGS